MGLKSPFSAFCWCRPLIFPSFCDLCESGNEKHKNHCCFTITLIIITNSQTPLSFLSLLHFLSWDLDPDYSDNSVPAASGHETFDPSSSANIKMCRFFFERFECFSNKHCEGVSLGSASSWRHSSLKSISGTFNLSWFVTQSLTLQTQETLKEKNIRNSKQWLSAPVLHYLFWVIVRLL